MTPERKKLQDKLRRKYEYQTSQNGGRAISLIKPNSSTLRFTDYKKETDMAFVMFPGLFGKKNGDDCSIQVILNQYKVTEGVEPEHICGVTALMNFEELEMIYKIACVAKKEAEG